MNVVSTCNAATSEYERYEPGLVTELVRGTESALLDRMLPLVREQNVSLDLHAVSRIDAAGLTTLIRLYCAAREAGHTFAVANPSPHVAEILAMVGLEGFLLARDADKMPCFRTQFEETAA